MMSWGWRMGDGAGVWWLLGLLSIVVLAVALVWLLVSTSRGSRNAPPQQPWQPPYPGPMPSTPVRPTPYEILRERLARGEVTVEDYQRTLEALGPEPGAPGQQPTPQGPQPPPSF